LMANLGTGKDKFASAFYSDSLLTSGELVSAYRSAWLPRKLVDAPARDCFRQWRAWDDERVADVEESLDLRRKALEAYINARLFGGGALFIGTNVNILTGPIRDSETVRYLNVLRAQDVQIEGHETDMT